MKKRYKYQVTTRMKRAHREGQWRFAKSKDFLKQYPCFASILNKLWHLTWYDHISACLLDLRFSVQYIGRYTKRAVMAEYRIVYYDGKIVRFSYKDYAEGGKTSLMTLKVHTFIARLIRHIPDKHFPMIRYQKGIRLRRIWECHDCYEGVVVPGTYKNIHGEFVRIDPKNRDPNTEVIRF